MSYKAKWLAHKNTGNMTEGDEHNVVSGFKFATRDLVVRGGGETAGFRVP